MTLSTASWGCRFGLTLEQLLISNCKRFDCILSHLRFQFLWEIANVVSRCKSFIFMGQQHLQHIEQGRWDKWISLGYCGFGEPV